MSLTRRRLLRQATLASGALFTPHLLSAGEPAATSASGPRRVIFFIQNHGFDIRHSWPSEVDFPADVNSRDVRRYEDGVVAYNRAATPDDQVIDLDLTALKLPKWIDPLEAIKDKVTIVHGLNGRHVSSFHGAPYGAMGGYLSGALPQAETIDCALGRHIPGVLPLLSVGLGNARSRGIKVGCSAWAGKKPVPMPQSPLEVYDKIFALSTSDQARAAFEYETDYYEFLRGDTAALLERVPTTERGKIRSFDDGLVGIAARRRKLAAMSDTLKRYAPDTKKRFATPSTGNTLPHWEAHVANVIAALKAGVTNVATLCAGMCRTGGLWTEIGVQSRGHGLGHTLQHSNPEWLTLRHYNMRILLQMVRALEAEPEGSGNMMDNTLIVFTSDFAEGHHSIGQRWPFLLIGNLGGTIRTGRLIHYPVDPFTKEGTYKTTRSINSFYTTLLRAVGAKADWFNHLEHMKEHEPAGPLPELMA